MIDVSIVPFLDKAIKVRTVQGNISTKFFYVSSLTSKIYKQQYESNEEFKKLVDTLASKANLRKYTVVVLEPVNLVVPQVSNLLAWVLKTRVDYIDASVIYYDYRVVANTVETYKVDEGRYKVAYPELNGYSEIEVSSLYLFDSVINGVSDDISRLFKGEELEGASPDTGIVESQFDDKVGLLDINEISLDDFSSIDYNLAISAGSVNPIKIRLDNYFGNNYTTNRVPLLIGPSAVAKSSLVKSLVSKYGMRLVDLRLAFTSRLDIEGLTTREERDDGWVSEAAPASFMVECSDAYIDFCRNAVKELEEELKALGEGVEKEALLKVLFKYREGAKTPVLFLDEITRCSPSVRQAFTKILTDKAFMQYPMTYARVLAATNSMLDLSESGEMADIFLTNDAGDSAFFDRFESIPVKPADIYQDWLGWANTLNEEGKAHIHRIILDYIGEDPLARSYNFEMAYAGTDMSAEEVTTNGYPNYRTWEMVSNYLYSLGESKEYNSLVIKGLIGNNIGEEFCSLLESKYDYISETPRDVLSDYIKDGLNSGVPLLIVSSSGIGKSSRVKAIAKERGAKLIEINLAEQDSVDLLGAPVRVSVESYVSKDVTLLSNDIQDKIKSLVKESGLPGYLTIKAPKATLLDTIRECAESGQEVIVFYDELNRVQNPNVMSSVFEAISDNRVMGVNFKPGAVKVVAACNMGSSYSDAQPLDPALSARFAIYKKYGYNKEDVKSYVNYLKSSGCNKVILDWFGRMPEEDLIALLISVEDRTIEQSASSTRAWEDLSKFLNTSKDLSITGKTLFYDDTVMQAYQDIGYSKDKRRSIQALLNAMDLNHLDSWAGCSDSINAFIRGRNGLEEVKGEELIELFLEAKLDFDEQVLGSEDKLYNVIVYMMTLEQKVYEVRDSTFSYFLGSDNGFNHYYNKVACSENVKLTIKDCTTPGIFGMYINQEFETADETSWVDKVLNILLLYWETFGSNDKNKVRVYTDKAIECLGSLERRSLFYQKFADSELLIPLVKVWEDYDNVWVASKLQEVGIKISDELIREAALYKR